MPPTIARYCTPVDLETVRLSNEVRTIGVTAVCRGWVSSDTRNTAGRRTCGAYNGPMSKLDEAGRLLAELTNSEKAQLLKWVVLDLSETFPGIEADPVVSGGEPCIVRTRIPVW